MIIRDEQIRILNAYTEDAYLREMAGHLRSFAPKLCEIVGEATLLGITKSGIKKARSYGLTNRGPVRFFLELTCTLGSGFETDPQLKWASEVLTDESIRTDMLRAGHLYGRMTAYLDQVAGPNHQYAIDALKRLLEYGHEIPSREAWSQRLAASTMARLYPEKFDFIGESIASGIARQADEEAAKYGLPSREGAAVLTGMKFAMGHQVCEDPFYPWIAATLNDPLTVNGEGRLTRLVSKLRTYGAHVLAYFSQP